MAMLFSYVVDHDNGRAPYPFGAFCTLAECKYGTKRRNIIEMAEIGDWVAGTGGKSRESAGHGKLIYAMRVDDKIPLIDYRQAHRGDRFDANGATDGRGRFALISNHFFYFGANARDISEIPRTHLGCPFENPGRGYRRDFAQEFVADFAKWLEDNFKVGVNGPPCRPSSELEIPERPLKLRRKGCR
jgi:hypothetical protein